MITYRLTLAHPEAHLFAVEVTIPQPDPAGQHFTLPAWIPGSYMIRDFAKHLITLHAESAGTPVALRKLDKQSWQAAPISAPLTLRYQVYAWDLSVRGAHFDTTHAYFNGTCLLLRISGQDHQPHRLLIERPSGAGYRDWQLASTLPKVADQAGLFGVFECANYLELVDHPVEIGRLIEIPFSVAGTPHRMVLQGRIPSLDRERLAADLERICAQQVALFGELPAMAEYLFLVTAVGEGYGGLEHRDGCSLLCRRDDLPKPGEREMSEGYRRFLGLCSHEYFHLWNVKRIRPQAFMDGGLEREVHTELLWAFEGITAYYDDRMLLRSGVITPASWLELLAISITRLQRNHGRRLQSLAESSFDAWTKFYQQGENASNAIVSYYNKGALVALALDLTMRRDSNGRYTLDDLLRALWQHYGRSGKGVVEGEIEQLACTLTGLDLHPFFAQALHRCDELPLASLLADFGIVLHLRPPTGPEDNGGYRATPPPSPPPAYPHLGVTLAPGSEARIASVAHQSLAEQAGLAAGDQLVAVNGLRSERSNLWNQIAELPCGQPATLHAFRRDELLILHCTPQPAIANTCELWLLPEPSPTVRQRREVFL